MRKWQLFSMIQRSIQTRRYRKLRITYNIEGVKKEARQAAAIGLAAANLRYEDAPGALSVVFSSGSWHSQSAIAFGAGYTSESGDIRSNFSVTTAGGHWGIGAGISVRLK